MTRRLARRDHRRRPNLQEVLALQAGSEAHMTRVFGSLAAAREAWEIWRDRPELASRGGRRPGGWWRFDSGAGPELWRDARDALREEETVDEAIERDELFELRRVEFLVEGRHLGSGETESVVRAARMHLDAHSGYSSAIREGWRRVLEVLSNE